MTTTRRWVSLIVTLIAVAGAGYLFWSSWIGKGKTKEQDKQKASCMQGEGENASPVVLCGWVRTDKSAILPRADVRLGLFDSKGVLVYRTPPFSLNALNGEFLVTADQVPLLPDIKVAKVTSEVRHHLSASADLIVQFDPQGKKLSFAPNRIWLQLTPVDPVLTLLFLGPGLVGVLLSVVYLSTSLLRKESSVLYFATVSAAAWTFCALGMTVMFLFSGDYLIPTFFLDAYLPSGVIVFSYLGTLTYVAYSLVDKPDGFFDESTPEKWRRHIRLVGGRILIGPYVSSAAYLTFLSAFPTLGSGSGAVLFAFFSGLYIKPVLEAIQGIGIRMLSAESQQKVVERFARASAPEAPPQPSSVASMAPNQALIDAVQRAKAELLAKPEVVGVIPTQAAGSQGKAGGAIRVYVYGDAEAGAANELPATMHGFPLDVLPVPPPDPNQPCRPALSGFDWRKIQRDLLGEGGIAADSGVVCQRMGDLVVLADPFQTLFRSAPAALFDAATATHYVLPVIDDRADFLLFLIDPGAGRPQVGNYHVSAFNDVQGTNYSSPGNPGSQAPPDRYGSAQLRGINVFGYHPWTMRTLLHEMGHYWCAYATLRADAQSGDSFELLIGQGQGQFSQDRMHWGLQFDAGRSPMDYDQIEWRPGAQGKLIGFELDQLCDKDEFLYCPLDLYLMGLIPAAEVGPLRIISGAETQELIDGRVRRVRSIGRTASIEDVVRSCGELQPPFQPGVRELRAAFVVVSNNLDGSFIVSANRSILKIAEERRLAFMAGFKRATGGRATVQTTLG